MRKFMPNRSLSAAALGALAAALLMLPRPLAAQQTTTPAVAAAKKASRQHDGIKVHGWWTIVVTNPDGSVAQKREFENSLTSYGATALLKVITAQYASGNWGIWLSSGSTTSNPPCAGVSTCVISVSGSSLLNSDANASGDLKLAFNGGTMTLTGSYAANQNGTVGQVQTLMGYCSAAIAPVSCDANYSVTFTQKTLSSPISVTSGQTINITVNLFFS